MYAQGIGVDLDRLRSQRLFQARKAPPSRAGRPAAHVQFDGLLMSRSSLAHPRPFRQPPAPPTLIGTEPTFRVTLQRQSTLRPAVPSPSPPPSPTLAPALVGH